MHLHMDHGERLSPKQMCELLRASETVRLAGQSRAEVYAWIQQTLLWQEYFSRGNRGWTPPTFTNSASSDAR